MALLCTAAASAQIRETAPAAASAAVDIAADLSSLTYSTSVDGEVQSSANPGGPWAPAKGEVTKSVRIPFDSQRAFFRTVDDEGRPSPVVQGTTPPPPGAPYTAQHVQVTRLSEKTARATVVYIPSDSPPGATVSLFVGKQMILFRDDGTAGDEKSGDRIFTGDVPLSVAELAATNKALEKLPEEGRVHRPIFGRQMGKPVPLKPFDLEAYMAGKPLTLMGQAPPTGRRALSPMTAAAASACSGSPFATDPAKTLTIVDPSVVDDADRTFDPCTGSGTPMGAWTFGRLMTDLCNQPATGIDPSDFTLRWLESWATPQTINSDVVPERNAPGISQLISQWQAVSGGPGAPLDLRMAPFRLTAIVNRIDLRQNVGYGGGTRGCESPCSGGEARFVFCAIDQTGCNQRPFTVIFEYGICRETCVDQQDWAKQWTDLNSFTLPDPSYNKALQAITDQFALANTNMNRAPNFSSLNQLRANEIALTPAGSGPTAGDWELREWKLFCCDSDAGWLRETTVKQTPHWKHNGGAIISNYITANLPALSTTTHVVPLQFGAQAFLGGAAPVSFAGFGLGVWDGSPSLPIPERHIFSLNTCQGCHGGETNTRFVHVECRPFGGEAALSGFLTGQSPSSPNPPFNPLATFVVTDPVSGASNSFADLARRVEDMDCLVNCPCFLIPFAKPLAATH
jgi:hypothetical protein